MKNNKIIERIKNAIYKTVFIANAILYIYLITSLININFQKELINNIILIVSFFFISFHYLIKILDKDEVVISIKKILKKIDTKIANFLGSNQEKLTSALGNIILFILFLSITILLLQTYENLIPQ